MEKTQIIGRLIDSLPSALMVVDEQLNIVLFNQHLASLASKLIKESFGALPGARLTTAFPMLLLHEKKLKELVATGGSLILESVEHREEQYNCYFKVACYPLQDMPGMLMQLEDINEKVLHQQQLLNYEKMNSLDGLAAGIAHEISNPLSAILNASQNISLRLDPRKEANRKLANELGLDLNLVQQYLQAREIPFFLESVEEGANRANDIVVKMLNFSNRVAEPHELIDINELLEQAIKYVSKDSDLNNNSAFSKIEIVRNLEYGLPRISVLPMELRQVLVNLLNNAQQAIEELQSSGKKHSGRAGKITLQTGIAANCLNIVVADNGCGMSAEIKRKIFDPYFTTRQSSGGHGFGLSTVKRTVLTLLKGSIEVTSAVNVGSSFVLSLPLRQ